MISGLYLIFAFIGLSFFSGISNTSSRSREIHNKKNLITSTEKHAFPFNPLNDALQVIKKTLGKEKKRKPYKISTTYKMNGKKPVEAVTEMHYKEYRKKPRYECRRIYHSENTDDEIEEILFTYRRHSKYITQVKKYKNHNNCEKIRIKISTGIINQCTQLV